ncbi:Bacterial Ig-like domain (group 2) [compost metagenome]
MMTLRNPSVAALLLASVLTVGCQTRTTPPQTAALIEDGMQVQAADTGLVEIRVRWPEVVQAIPYSANSLVVTAFDWLGREAGTATLTRTAASDSLSTAALRLRAGTYTIEAKAYRELSPTVTSVPTAMGSAPGVMIKTNLKTYLPLTLQAQEPTFGAMSATAGGSGSQFTIDAVRFFNRSVTLADTLEVFLGYNERSRVKASVSIEPRRQTAPVTGINHLIDPERDKVRVTVPRGLSGTCEVWLRVDGVEVRVGQFRVIDRMVLEPVSVTRQVGESYEAKSQLAAFSLENTVGMGSLPYPMVTWTSSAPSVAFVTTTGTVYAYRPGRATLTARSGDVVASVDLIATDRHSTASVTVSTPELNSGHVSAPVTLPAYSGDDTATVTH